VPERVTSQAELSRVGAAGLVQYRQGARLNPPRLDPAYRQAQRTARQAIERLHAKQRAERQQRLDRREPDQVDQPLTRSMRADRARSPQIDERERGVHECEAG
jgi:hypothetical protein